MPKRLLPLLLLLLLIPAGIWAIANTRLDIRNRAANTISCWNTVVTMPDGLYWRSRCDTSIINFMCKTTLTKLTQAEELAYNTWVSAGRPEITGCQPESITVTGKVIQPCVPPPIDTNTTDSQPPQGTTWCSKKAPGSPPITGLPKPSPGCYYSRVMCVQAPCDPIIICPTPVPCDGPDGSACTLGSCPPCTDRICPMVMCQEQIGVCRNKQCVATPSSAPIVIGPVTPGVGGPLFTTSAPAYQSPTPTKQADTAPTATPVKKRVISPTPTSSFTGGVSEDVVEIINMLSLPRSSQTSSDVGLADYNDDGVVDNYDLVQFILSHE